MQDLRGIAPDDGIEFGCRDSVRLRFECLVESVVNEDVLDRGKDIVGLSHPSRRTSCSDSDGSETATFTARKAPERRKWWRRRESKERLGVVLRDLG